MAARFFRKQLSLLILCACFLAPRVHAEADRIWLPAKINGKPARFIFDTGMGEIALWRQSAKKLGLSTYESPADSGTLPSSPLQPGEVIFREWTEECDLAVWDTTIKYSLAVLDIPEYLLDQADCPDGALGWYPFRKTIFAIDAAGLKVEPLSRVPKQAAAWTQLHVSTYCAVLNLETPARAGPTLRINVDTGYDGGVSLRPDLWRQWKTAHPKAPATLVANWMPALGNVVVEEEDWADELRLGPLLLSGVPIKENNQANMAHDATLGMTALKHLRFIVDGEQGVAYLQSKKSAPPPYKHNRVGAVFVPSGRPDDDALVAHVLPGSPAYEAGIRDGDELLGLDGRDVTRWRADPAQLALLDFERPAGTRISAALKRDGKTFAATIISRQILGPGLQER